MSVLLGIPIVIHAFPATENLRILYLLEYISTNGTCYHFTHFCILVFKVLRLSFTYLPCHSQINCFKLLSFMGAKLRIYFGISKYYQCFFPSYYNIKYNIYDIRLALPSKLACIAFSFNVWYNYPSIV